MGGTNHYEVSSEDAYVSVGDSGSESSQPEDIPESLTELQNFVKKCKEEDSQPKPHYQREYTA